MKNKRSTGWRDATRMHADSAITAVYHYFDNKPETSRFLGLTFLTSESRRQYLLHITERWEGDETRIKLIFDRLLLSRGMRINFWRYLMILLGILFAMAHFNPHHPFAILLYGGCYYGYTHLAFLYGLEAGHHKLALQIFGMVGRKQKIRDAQKPVSIVVDKDSFQFSLQDILTVEYFVWKAKENTAVISFSTPVNSKVIEEKIFRKWHIKKPASFARLIAIPKNAQFSFLSYRLHKDNRKFNAVNIKLEAIVNYLAASNFLRAKRLLEEYFYPEA